MKWKMQTYASGRSVFVDSNIKFVTINIIIKSRNSCQLHKLHHSDNGQQHHLFLLTGQIISVCDVFQIYDNWSDYPAPPGIIVAYLYLIVHFILFNFSHRGNSQNFESLNSI